MTTTSLISFPFGVFAWSMAILVIALNSTIPNLGITVRMRTQLMPFLLMLLLYKKPGRWHARLATRSRRFGKAGRVLRFPTYHSVCLLKSRPHLRPSATIIVCGLTVLEDHG
jgi:hypothetical protein